MPEIARFKSCRIWRRPLLQPAVKRTHLRKRLQISEGSVVAVIVFEKQSGVWIAAEVPRFLTYLQGTRAADMKLELQKLGFEWQWLA